MTIDTAEIASAKTWGETQAATVQDRDDQICGLEIQIAALRSQVQAADILREAAGDMLIESPDVTNYAEIALCDAIQVYDATKTDGMAAQRFGWPIHTNAGGLPEISVVCKSCGSQYYWPLNDRGELELTPTQMECDCEATPPAVADAGETGEEDLFDFTITGTLEDDRKEMQADNSFKGVLYRLAYMEARDDINREEVTALRRDVDKSTVTVESLRQSLGNSLYLADERHDALNSRIVTLESRDHPEPGTVVTDEMVERGVAAFRGSFEKLGSVRAGVSRAIDAALAAKDGGT